MIRNLIFDMDGTLLDTLADLTDSVNHVLSMHGMPARTVSEVRLFVGNGLDRLMLRALPDGTPAELQTVCCRELRAWYRDHAEVKTRPYEGIAPLLAALRARGIGTAVVTNKDQRAAEALTDEWFPGLFDAVIGDDGATPPKPDPAGVFAAMRALGAAPADTLFVGDSDVDVRTALNAGLDCVGVLWGFRDRQLLLDTGAKYIAAVPDDVLRVAEKHG